MNGNGLLVNNILEEFRGEDIEAALVVSVDMNLDIKEFSLDWPVRGITHVGADAYQLDDILKIELLIPINGAAFRLLLEHFQFDIQKVLGRYMLRVKSADYKHTNKNNRRLTLDLARGVDARSICLDFHKDNYIGRLFNIDNVF